MPKLLKATHEIADNELALGLVRVISAQIAIRFNAGQYTRRTCQYRMTYRDGGTLVFRVGRRRLILGLQVLLLLPTGAASAFTGPLRKYRLTEDVSPKRRLSPLSLLPGAIPGQEATYFPDAKRRMLISISDTRSLTSQQSMPGIVSGSPIARV